MTSSDETPTAKLAEYIVYAPSTDLPAEITERAKHHILDTLAAMVSGAVLPVGKMAHNYASLQGAEGGATIVGLPKLHNGVFAALVNGMLAHADETDDSHAAAGMHPGCAIVPAALAMAEKNRVGGSRFLKAVVLGYDVGARLMRAIGADINDPNRRYDTHAFGGTFGASAAAAACMQKTVDVVEARFLLSYAAHQASGMASYPMDSFHVEKAFIFGGMPARNGMTAATMLEAGFTGIEDDLEGHNGFLMSFGDGRADPVHLSEALGERFEITRTNIKKYSVGSPIQAPVDCLVNIMRDHCVSLADLNEIVVYTARGEDRITRRDQHMSNLNLRYLLAVTLIEGHLTFAAAHDDARVHDPEVERITGKISIRANLALASPESPRQGIVEFVTKDGRTFSNHVIKVRGAMEDPMSTEEVVAKARELLQIALPDKRVEQVISGVLEIETITEIGKLTHLLRPN